MSSKTSHTKLLILHFVREIIMSVTVPIEPKLIPVNAGHFTLQCLRKWPRPHRDKTNLLFIKNCFFLFLHLLLFPFIPQNVLLNSHSLHIPRSDSVDPWTQTCRCCDRTGWTKISWEFKFFSFFNWASCLCVVLRKWRGCKGLGWRMQSLWITFRPPSSPQPPPLPPPPFSSLWFSEFATRKGKWSGVWGGGLLCKNVCRGQKSSHRLKFQLRNRLRLAIRSKSHFFTSLSTLFPSPRCRHFFLFVILLFFASRLIGSIGLTLIFCWLLATCKVLKY